MTRNFSKEMVNRLDTSVTVCSNETLAFAAARCKYVEAGAINDPIEGGS